MTNRDKITKCKADQGFYCESCVFCEDCKRAEHWQYNGISASDLKILYEMGAFNEEWLDSELSTRDDLTEEDYKRYNIPHIYYYG